MEGVTGGQIRKWTDAEWVGEDADWISPSGISTDTRSLQEGEAFIALRGPNFDGNQFLGEAFDRGACVALTDSREGAGSHLFYLWATRSGPSGRSPGSTACGSTFPSLG